MDWRMDTYSLCTWVSPFRYLRIIAYLQLPEAFRSLSRLSSALSAKASTLRSLLLNHTCKNKSDCIALQSHAKQSFALSRHSSNDCASTSLSSLLAYVVHKELMLFFRCISTSPTFLSASDVLSLSLIYRFLIFDFISYFSIRFSRYKFGFRFHPFGFLFLPDCFTSH